MKSAPLDDTIELSNRTVKLQRAGELDELIQSLRSLIIPFVQAADDAAKDRATGALSRDSLGSLRNVLVNSKRPEELAAELRFDVPDEGVGKDGLLRFIGRLLALSVNTWDQGFLDKLYASNTPVGVISDTVLSVLNTNLHVYQVSPALSVIEKTITHALATRFGFTGPFAGGISCQGGSSSNLTSLVVARNILHPDTKTVGNEKREFVIFTSAHGHYSVEKSAMICGFGDSSVWKIPVNKDGSMIASELRKMVVRAKGLNKVPSM